MNSLNEKKTVLDLQKIYIKKSSDNGKGSNISISCKTKSGISVFSCVFNPTN